MKHIFLSLKAKYNHRLQRLVCISCRHIQMMPMRFPHWNCHHSSMDSIRGQFHIHVFFIWYGMFYAL